MANLRKLTKMGATMERTAGNPKASKTAKAVSEKAKKVQTKGFAPRGTKIGKKTQKQAMAVSRGMVKQYKKTTAKGK